MLSVMNYFSNNVENQSEEADEMVSIPDEEISHPIPAECNCEEKITNLEREIDLLKKVNLSLIDNRAELAKKFQNFGIMAISTVTVICGVSLFSDDLAVITWMATMIGMGVMIPSETLFYGSYLGSVNDRLLDNLYFYNHFIAELKLKKSN